MGLGPVYLQLLRTRGRTEGDTSGCNMGSYLHNQNPIERHNYFALVTTPIVLIYKRAQLSVKDSLYMYM